MSENKSTKENADNELFSDLGSSKYLWKKDLTWTLELRFLIRFLADKLLYGKDQTDSNLLQESKIRAENFVSGFLKHEVSEN